MQFNIVALILAAASQGVLADLHDSLVCVSGNTVNTDATRCACNLYRQRNTGNNQWDQCPDCTFDGTSCRSSGFHLGGDEMHHYCTERCGATGSQG